MNDQKIIKLYFDRNEQAIKETANKYGNYCTTIARNILGNEEDVKECINDTYLRAWNSIPPNKPTILQAFLGKITRNLSLNRYKHNNAIKRGSNEVPLVLDEIAELVSGTESVEATIDYKELVNAINSFLEELPNDKKNIFVSRYWYFNSIAEIAKCYGMTQNNVSVTLNRLRLKLHNYLLERGFWLWKKKNLHTFLAILMNNML